jgi:hypothetical protein
LLALEAEVAQPLSQALAPRIGLEAGLPSEVGRPESLWPSRGLQGPVVLALVLGLVLAQPPAAMGVERQAELELELP